jgi:import receptor subunit TOM22
MAAARALTDEIPRIAEDEEDHSDFETDSESDIDSDDEDIEYRGILGMLYRAKDWCEDAVERANESAAVQRSKTLAKQASSAGWSLTGKGGKAMWVIGTSLVIMVLPLVLEVEREQGFIEAQQQQEALLRQQGYSPQQLAQMGVGAPQRR